MQRCTHLQWRWCFRDSSSRLISENEGNILSTITESYTGSNSDRVGGILIEFDTIVSLSRLLEAVGYFDDKMQVVVLN